MPRITSWSYTRYKDYKDCPAKAKYKHVDKLKEPGNEAMQRGADIAKLAEGFLKGEIPRLPKELKKFAKDFRDGKAMAKKRTVTTIIEDTWAFTKDWFRTTWDNWKGCWLRVKLDYAYIKDDVLYITDWKTGKFRVEQKADYLEQLELYALAGLIIYPHVKTVSVRLGYLDLGLTYPPEHEPIIYHQTDVPKLKETWLKRIKPMFADETFAPKPNRNCPWCYYRKSNGGPCQY